MRRSRLQRPVGLGDVDLGGDAEAVFFEPGPGADDRHSSIVAVAVDVDRRCWPWTASAAIRVSGCSDPPCLRPLSRREIALRVADLDTEDRRGGGRVREQADGLEVVDAAQVDKVVDQVVGVAITVEIRVLVSFREPKDKPAVSEDRPACDGRYPHPVEISRLTGGEVVEIDAGCLADSYHEPVT